MSLEMNVFLEKARIPDRSSWQAAVSSLGLPFELNPDLDPLRDRGFSSSKLEGHHSGFEILFGVGEERRRESTATGGDYWQPRLMYFISLGRRPERLRLRPGRQRGLGETL